MMVNALRNRVKTIDLASELNKVLKVASDQREVVDSILD
jgi:hypothetical protein